jgi:hypothetical protein
MDSFNNIIKIMVSMTNEKKRSISKKRYGLITNSSMLADVDASLTIRNRDSKYIKE